MKKGINAWAFPSDIPMKQRMETAKKAGFIGFELLFEKEGFIGLNSRESDLKEIRRFADGIGIEIPSLVGVHYDELALSSSSASAVHEFGERFKRMLRAAALLGADTVLLVAGHCVSTRHDPDGQYDIAYDNAVRNVTALASSAKTEGVNIGIEPVWNKFLLSPIEMRAFIDYAGSPWVGSYFDVGNVMPWGFPEQWIRILGHRIKKIHFKDFKVGVGTMYGFVDLLAGDVDFPEVMKALREIKFDSYCTAETDFYKHDPITSTYHTSAVMDAIYKM